MIKRSLIPDLWLILNLHLHRVLRVVVCCVILRVVVTRMKCNIRLWIWLQFEIIQVPWVQVRLTRIAHRCAGLLPPIQQHSLLLLLLWILHGHRRLLRVLHLRVGTHGHSARLSCKLLPIWDAAKLVVNGSATTYLNWSIILFCRVIIYPHHKIRCGWTVGAWATIHFFIRSIAWPQQLSKSSSSNILGAFARNLTVPLRPQNILLQV